MTEQISPAAMSLISALRRARNDGAVESALKQRVQSRLSVSLLGLTPTLPADFPATSAFGGAAQGGSLAAKGASATKGVVLAWLAPVFAIGMVTGVAVDQLHARHMVRHSNALSPIMTQPHISVNPQPEPNEIPTISPESLEDISNEHVSASVSAGNTDSATSLAAERRLLDNARQALARGEPQIGLAPLYLHTKRFPKGVLTEEREALAVRLLAALGSQQAALARANSFRRRFPNSLFIPAVDNAVVTLSKRNSEGKSSP